MSLFSIIWEIYNKNLDPGTFEEALKTSSASTFTVLCLRFFRWKGPVPQESSWLEFWILLVVCDSKFKPKMVLYFEVHSSQSVLISNQQILAV